MTEKDAETFMDALEEMIDTRISNNKPRDANDDSGYWSSTEQLRATMVALLLSKEPPNA